MDLSTGDSGAPVPSTVAPPPPPPAPPLPPPVPAEQARLRSVAVGQLTPGWRIFTVAVWSLVFVALLAVSNVSRQLGLATWWLGPLGDPRPFVVQILPFLPSAAMVLAAINNSRFVPWLGIGASLCVAAVGIADLGTVTRLGIVELGIAGAALAATIASLAGRYR